MEKLLIAILAATLYAGLISVGVAKRFDDEIMLRPIVVGGGVLIVIGAYGWYKGDAELFTELFFWFAACSAPMWTRSGILYLQQRDAEALRRHSLYEPDGVEMSRHDGA